MKQNLGIIKITPIFVLPKDEDHMTNAPLAERLRPKKLQDYVGQKHLVAPGSPIKEMLEARCLRSFILWGPPGVGKTTLANIVANELGLPFYTLSATSSGVKDVREVVERARQSRGLFSKGTPILFIDEIHRFSKSQQDSLLHAVETGVITLIGATTENPSFEVIRPLLSRCRVFVMEPLGKEDMDALIDIAITKDKEMAKHTFDIRERDALHTYAAGDGRKLLNILELFTTMPGMKEDEVIVIDNNRVTSYLQQNPAAYDKGGELHYDIISAYIKSIRGSAPNAALYWLARMIEGGEDPRFIARRLVIAAAEDIGLANPNALLIAQSAFDAVEKIGWPEGRIPLAEATIYLATSPKSNSAYVAIDNALEYVRTHEPHPVPMHLRNAPTALMKEIGYGKGYHYPHAYEGGFHKDSYAPPEVEQAEAFWTPGSNANEQRLVAQQPTN